MSGTGSYRRCNACGSIYFLYGNQRHTGLCHDCKWSFDKFKEHITNRNYYIVHFGEGEYDHYKVFCEQGTAMIYTVEKLLEAINKGLESGVFTPDTPLVTHTTLTLYHHNQIVDEIICGGYVTGMCHINQTLELATQTRQWKTDTE